MAEKWNLKGTYFEACNCEAVCPCVVLNAPTQGECTGLVGWHIEKGAFGGVKLDGLNVALAIHSPGHMMEVKWKAALYLDERADEAQTSALTKIFTGQAGGVPGELVPFVGEMLGVKSVPIDYRAEGKRRSLRIAGVAEADIEAIAGQGGADVTLDHVPFTPVPGHPQVVAKSGKLHYRDHGLRWEISGKNGFYSDFSYGGG